jgi:TolB-like protein/DNA-binding winged helix-turn-helix (wHTH) protein/Tfp pilus assembly protein PilF
MSRSAPSAAPLLRFDNFELDLYAGELRRRGVKLRLQGQPLQVLAILLQSAGNLVTREELRNQLWPVDTFVDFDHSLHNAIARIREVLGDSAQTPTYIETLPRRGYRFIAPVEEVPPPSIPAESNGHARELVLPPAPAAARQRRRLGLVVAVCLCCVVALAVWIAWQHRQLRSIASPPRSIAVIPLQNLSGDPSQEFFADGLTDQLITELSQIPELRVISHTSVKEYKATTKHLPQIARELKVDDILEGSVVREGDQVRVTVQLLDGPNDRHLWSENYQRPMRSILTVQRDIAQAVAQQVRVKLSRQQQAPLGASSAVDPAAYEAFLRGRYYLMTQYNKPQGLDAAQRYYEEAIRKDRGFALAYAGLADTWLNQGMSGNVSSQAAYGAAMDAVNKALALGGNTGEAHFTLAMLSWIHDWDPVTAEREFNYSIALSPSYDCAHEYYAGYLAWRHRREEALAQITKARELNPNLSFADMDSALYFQLRDYPSLIEASREGVTSDPDKWDEHYYLGVGYEATGRRAEAIPEYQKAIDMSGGDEDSTSALAYAYAMLGRKPEAEKILFDLQHRPKGVSPYSLAAINAGLGRKDAALELIGQAIQQRAMGLVWSLPADPRMDTLRSDPRFQAFLRQVGVPQ